MEWSLIHVRVGLAYVPGVYELNPVIAPVFAEIGLIYGLIVSSFAVVVAIVTVTEAAALVVARRRRDGYLAPLVRAVGYGLPSLCFAVVAVHNAAVLLAGIEAVGAVGLSSLSG